MSDLAEIGEGELRGRMTENAPLGEGGWFRCGGRAERLFKPADLEDLQAFLSNCAPLSLNPSPPWGEGKRSEAAQGEGDAAIHIFGVLSNTIVRDGGLPGTTVRLGKEFAKVEVLDDTHIRAGAMALDGTLAQAAAKAGIAGLEFYSGIPGTIGGALRMNAGCYGTETKDVLVEAQALNRQGDLVTLIPSRSSLRKQGPGSHEAQTRPDSRVRRNDNNKKEMGMSYRHNDLPEDYIFISATFRGERGDAEKIRAHMKEIKERRNATQPIREKTGGSTFANPSPEEIEKAGLPEGTKVWQLIDSAGGRGLTIGGAQMSEKHCNFMINTGSATAADLENLGEEIRKRVFERHGITLRWEIRRVGEPRVSA